MHRSERPCPIVRETGYRGVGFVEEKGVNKHKTK